MSQRILLVGHCGVDGPRLQSEISQFMGKADVLRVNTDADLRRACEEGVALLLVNREPLGFEPKLGQDLIRELREEYPDHNCILVSDHEDAQRQASQAGALPGFGKSDIGSPKFEEAVRKALSNG